MSSPACRAKPAGTAALAVRPRNSEESATLSNGQRFSNCLYADSGQNATAKKPPLKKRENATANSRMANGARAPPAGSVVQKRGKASEGSDKKQIFIKGRWLGRCKRGAILRPGGPSTGRWAENF